MIIRNNKDNVMFKPGYAYDDGHLIYSNIFIGDPIKTRQEIFEDVNYLNQKRINNVNAKSQISEFDKNYIATKPAKIFGYYLGEVISSLAGFGFLIYTAALMFNTYLGKTILIQYALLSLPCFAAAVYFEEKAKKILKIRKEAIEKIKIKKELRDRDVDLEYKDENIVKNEIEKEVVIKGLANAPLNQISNALDESFEQKLLERKEQIKKLEYINKKAR